MNDTNNSSIIECLAFVKQPTNYKIKKYNEKLNQALKILANDKQFLTTLNKSVSWVSIIYHIFLNFINVDNYK